MVVNKLAKILNYPKNRAVNFLRRKLLEELGAIEVFSSKGFKLESEWQNIRKGLSVQRISFSKEGRFAQGRAIKIKSESFKVALPYIIEMVKYDFGKCSILPDTEDKEFVAPSSQPLEQFLRLLREKYPKISIVFTCNSIYGNFLDPNSLLIAEGNLIFKPVRGTFQEIYKPPSGQFWFFVFDEESLGVRSLELREGRIRGDCQYKEAVMGLPLILDGERKDNLIKGTYPKPAKRGNQVYFDPTNYKAAMTAVGLDKNNEIIFLSMAGNPDNTEEVMINEMAEVMLLLETKEALLLGTSGDVQQFVSGIGVKDEYLIAKAQSESKMGTHYPIRPLSTIIVFYDKKHQHIEPSISVPPEKRTLPIKREEGK